MVVHLFAEVGEWFRVSRGLPAPVRCILSGSWCLLVSEPSRSYRVFVRDMYWTMGTKQKLSYHLRLEDVQEKCVALLVALRWWCSFRTQRGWPVSRTFVCPLLHPLFLVLLLSSFFSVDAPRERKHPCSLFRSIVNWRVSLASLAWQDSFGCLVNDSFETFQRMGRPSNP